MSDRTFTEKCSKCEKISESTIATGKPGEKMCFPCYVGYCYGLPREKHHLLEKAEKFITKERAEFVRDLRVNKHGTWREIARACNNAWDGDWGGLQDMGNALCEAAAKFFDEDYQEKPWN
jgi:hypothetical protein